MRRTFALLGMTLAICALAGAQEDTGNRVVIPPRNGSRPRVVEAALVNGTIHVTAAAGQDVIAEIPGWHPVDRNVPAGMHRIDMPAREGIQVQENGEVLRIGVGMAHRGSGLNLTVPTNTSLKVHTTNGAIMVTGVHGEIDAGSVNGEVTLT